MDKKVKEKEMKRGQGTREETVEDEERNTGKRHKVAHPSLLGKMGCGRFFPQSLSQTFLKPQSTWAAYLSHICPETGLATLV